MHVDVTMSNYKFEPAAIHLHHGAPYVITLHNQARGGHSFEAHGFFAAAQMPAADRVRIRNGEIEVPGGEEIAVSVIPSKSGTYRFHCTHPLHSLFGMTGLIVVD